ncbi:unnamed protein product [Ostreobium quekettii]|uniref:SET domain-containing protein n=1 Tax=Ostreobium quekettii TaxID=121088 RepID=A0A8S1IYG9_9CHLO|nr:unnamed protein product [Ostreobium quekettii]|eukprot:evm.model.scf_828EXC.11 EVM.evm.TU.scf_828EXC.11   scf_828EXC:55591-57336(-)
MGPCTPCQRLWAALVPTQGRLLAARRPASHLPPLLPSSKQHPEPIRSTASLPNAPDSTAASSDANPRPSRQPSARDGDYAPKSVSEWVAASGGDASRVEVRASSPARGRGLFAMREASPGDALLRVPMRLALEIYPFETLASAVPPPGDLADLLGPAANGALRLAAKLLAEKARGPSSPWWPYIASLPAALPNPASAIAGLDVRDVEYRPVLEAAYDHVRLVELAGGWEGLWRAAGAGIPDRGELLWALAVVESRAFGDGFGRDVLVPLADFMNHGGLVGSAEHPEANVTYGWRRLGHGAGPGAWEFVVQATGSIAEGGELLLAYGDHANEVMLLFYGFVPMFNAWDDYRLFSSPRDAFEWCWSVFPGEVAAEGGRAALFDLAMDCAAADAAFEVMDGGELRACVLPNAALPGPFRRFLEALFGGSEAAARRAVARACWQRLEGLSPLLADLSALSGGGRSDGRAFGAMLDHYCTEISAYLDSIGMADHAARRRALPRRATRTAHDSGGPLASQSDRGLGAGARQGGGTRPVVEGASPLVGEAATSGATGNDLVLRLDALKKTLLWDFVLDVRPSRSQLGL